MHSPTPFNLLNNHDEFRFRDESFEMDNSYVVKADIVRLSLWDNKTEKFINLLTEANLMTIVMRPGVGKSSLCEAFCANAVNPDCDAFKFKVDRQGRDVLFVDTERVINDLGKGYKQIVKRAKAYSEPDVMENSKLAHLKVVSYTVLDNADKYVKHLESHLAAGNYSLVILDQVADFLKSINKEEEAIAFVNKLKFLAAKYKSSFILTIHPNPMDKTFKPNGWIGSFLLKKSETVMVGYKIDNKVTLLTPNFDHGKVRNASIDVETGYKWSDEDGMHIHYEITQKSKETAKKYEFMDKIIYELFDEGEKDGPGRRRWLPGDLVVAIQDKVSKKDKALITEEFLQHYSVDMNVIQRFALHYVLVNSEDDSAPF